MISWFVTTFVTNTTLFLWIVSYKFPSLYLIQKSDTLWFIVSFFSVGLMYVLWLKCNDFGWWACPSLWAFVEAVGTIEHIILCFWVMPLKLATLSKLWLNVDIIAIICLSCLQMYLVVSSLCIERYRFYTECFTNYIILGWLIIYNFISRLRLWGLCMASSNLRKHLTRWPFQF